jgi:KDO2-lipid IV(A) lauroyltransferase
MRKVGLWKRFRRELRVRALLDFLPILSLLPHRAAVAVGGALGSLAWYALSRHRNIALRHLALAFPEQTASWRRGIGRASFANLGRSALELCVARRLDLLGSVGNWELLARRIASTGLPVGTIAREANDPRLTAILEEGRRATGIESFWRGKAGAIRGIVRHLKTGGVLAALIDQDTDVAAHFVPFFGRLARTPRAPADLAVRYGTGAILGSIHRVAPSVHRVVLRRLEIPQGTDADERSRKLTEAATAAVEAAVREHPDEWVWMHERWRSEP